MHLHTGELIRELIDSLHRDGADMPIVYVCIQTPGWLHVIIGTAISAPCLFLLYGIRTCTLFFLHLVLFALWCCHPSNITA